MVKKGVVLSVALLTFVSLAVFAGGASEGAVTKSKLMTIATDPLGTGTFGATAGVAKILNDQGGFNIKVKPTAGATEVAGLMSSGEAELGVLNSFEVGRAWLTEGDYEQYRSQSRVMPIRLLMGGPPTYSTATTHMRSGIESGADLKGKRFIGEYTSSPADTEQAYAYLANWGLSKNDVIWMATPGLDEAVEALIEGKADAIVSASIGQAVIEELNATKGARFLSFNTDPKALEAFWAKFPYAVSIETVEPAQGLTGVVEPTAFLKFEDFYIVNKGLSDDLVYEIVKTLYENNKELQTLHAVLEGFNQEAMLSLGLGVPYHPGAIKFFKEVGLWNNEVDAKNKALLEKEKSLQGK
jgi:TRAP transporter TAXI family solute receptor